VDDDGLDYHGPCRHCGRELWLVSRQRVRPESASNVHGFELPDGLGWLALADEAGWSACPVCGWAVALDAVSPN
jgi:hypothetical protein